MKDRPDKDQRIFCLKMSCINGRVQICFYVMVNFLLSAIAQGEKVTLEQKVGCVNQLVDLCNSIQYPNVSIQIPIVSNIFLSNDYSGKSWHISCSTNSDGTKCIRDNILWISCSSDNKVTYKSTVLEKDSTEGVDDEVCDPVQVFIESYQRLKQSMAHLENKLHALPQKISNKINREKQHLDNTMSRLKQRLSRLTRCLPFCD